MSYHVLWDERWDPDEVDTRLRSHGIPSRVEGDNVVIEFDEPRPSWLHPIRRISGILRPSPRMELVYNPDRIINRISILYFSNIPLDMIHKPLEATMRELGYLAVPEEISEREAVLNCCTPNSKLLRKLAALEEIDGAWARGNGGSENDYCSSRYQLVDDIEQMIVDSDDFAEPDFRPPVTAQ